MYPCDEQVLQQLLALIERDECGLALKTWSDYRRKVAKTCDHCPYAGVKRRDDCCMCLEAKLRNLSLYESPQDAFDKSLLTAARRLHEFRQQM